MGCVEIFMIRVTVGRVVCLGEMPRLCLMSLVLGAVALTGILLPSDPLVRISR